MKKFLPRIIIGLFCLAATGWAYWYGTVSWYDGGHVGKKAEVTAVGVGVPDVTVYTQSGGGYTLMTVNGMVENATYSKVRANKDREGENWRGYTAGGVFHQLGPHVEKNITLYPPEMWPEGYDD